MRLGAETAKTLAYIEHPPTPDAMRDIMHALAFDGDTERLNRLAKTMTDHHHHQSSMSSPLTRDQRDDERSWFYYWLGINAALGSMVVGASSRRSTRESARFRRSMARLGVAK